MKPYPMEVDQMKEWIKAIHIEQRYEVFNSVKQAMKDLLLPFRKDSDTYQVIEDTAWDAERKLERMHNETENHLFKYRDEHVIHIYNTTYSQVAEKLYNKGWRYKGLKGVFPPN